MGMTHRPPANQWHSALHHRPASGFADALETLPHGALEAALADCLALAGAGRDTAEVAVLRCLLIINYSCGGDSPC